MKLQVYLIGVSMCLMYLSESSASEINVNPLTSKLLSKLKGMKKQNPKLKLQRKSTRLPKMGFFGSSPFQSMTDDSIQLASPRQDFGSLSRQDFSGMLSGSSRLQSFDNSPVYYVRLPPTPYMYTPGLGYISQQQSSPMTTYHGNAINPFASLPINFLSNGQPNGAYDYSMPELMSSAFPGKGFLRQEPPIFGRKSFMEDSSFGTALKGRFDFNGRPDSVYVLPDNSFYQGSMFQ